MQRVHDDGGRAREEVRADIESAAVAASAGEGQPVEVAEKPTVRQRRDLITGPITPTLWRLAAPLTLGFVVNAAYSWIDMYFVSRLGDDAIAALGFADQINFVIFTLGSGFGIGTGIIVARRMGEGRRDEAGRIVGQSSVFLALYSTLAAVLLMIGLPILLPLFGLEGNTLSLTEAYMVTLMIGVPANLLTFHANSSVRSTGNTVFPMIVAIASTIVNALLAPFLIFDTFEVQGVLIHGAGMGIQGAAIATAVAQWSAALVALVALYRDRLGITVPRPSLRFDWAIFRAIFAVGFPASLQTLAVSTARVVMIALANEFGTAMTAAYTIGLRVDMLVYMPIFAVGIAIETLTSQNLGAGHPERVRLFRIASIKQLGGVILVLGAVIYFVAPAIAGIFSENAAVIDLTARYLHFAPFGYFFFVVAQSATRALSGAGHSMRSMLIVAVTLFLVQLPLAAALSMWTGLGANGIFIGMALSYLVLAVIALTQVRGTAWMQKRV